MNKKTLTLTIIGALLGLPLSYYLQMESVRDRFGGIGDYLTGLLPLLTEPGQLMKVRVTVIGSAIAGSMLGGILDFLWHLVKRTDPLT